jgi:hypothetical protein
MTFGFYIGMVATLAALLMGRMDIAIGLTIGQFLAAAFIVAGLKWGWWERLADWITR